MRTSGFIVLSAACLFSAISPFAVAEEASFSILGAKIAAAEDEIAQQYLVKIKRGAEGEEILSKLQNGQFEGVELTKLIRGKIAVINCDGDEAEAAFKVAAKAGIEAIEHDTIMHVDRISAPSHGRKIAAQDTPYGIGHVKAEEVSDEFVSNMKVCIIDSGYDINHDDLPSDPSIVTGKSFVNGRWDQDPNSHGTHVAGTIAAIDNNIGVKGVVRSGQMKLHIGRVFNRFGFGSASAIIDAFKDCVEEESNVISMSLGGGGFLQIFQDEINEATNQGILVVAAAGNSGRQTYEYPASYENVMSVASIDESYQRSSFSTYNDMVDIAGPGSSVLSTIPNNKYAVYSGTSMACPHVAAVAALVWSHAPETPVSDLRQILKDTATDLETNGYDIFYGNGLIDAKKAFDSLAVSGTPTISPAPSPSSTPAPTPSSPSDCENGFEVAVFLKTDDFPEETSWKIIDSDSSTIEGKNDFSDSNTMYQSSVCLPNVDGCPEDYYKFIINDSNGNGLERGSYYQVLVEGERFDSWRRFRGSQQIVDIPSCADEGPRCLDYDASSSCRDTDGCFYLLGNCSFCSSLGRIKCELAGACSWNGSSCE